MRIQCPNCGATIIFNKSAARFWGIYQQLREIERNYGKITTLTASIEIGYSESQMRRILGKMEQADMIARIGFRNGWETVEGIPMQRMLLN